MTPEEFANLKVGDRLHYDEFECRFTVGPRGGAYFRSNDWRVNGKMQPPFTVHYKGRIPIKFGMYRHGYLYSDDIAHWHLESSCKELKAYRAYMADRGAQESER